MADYERSINEGFGVSDSMAGTAFTPIDKSVNEGFGVSDSMAGTAFTPVDRSVNEGFGVSDALETGYQFSRSASESFGISDSVVVKNPSAVARDYPAGGVKTAFECTLLSGRESVSDLPVPISSFAIRGQHPYGSSGWTGDKYEYVTVQIPGNDLSEQIQANGDWWQLKIEIVQYYGGEEIFREILTQTNFPPFEINYYENLTPVIEITGTSRVSIWDTTGWKTGEITMHNPVYRATKNGIKEYRFKHIDPYAKAGWYIYVGDSDTTGFHCDKIDIEVTTTGINVVVQETSQDRGS